MGHSRQKCRRVSENFTVILDRLAWMTEPTRSAVSAWIEKANLKAEHYLFPSRLAKSPHVSTRQYARIVHQWVAAIGLDSTVYGTHSMRRTKATLIYKRTKNLRAVQRIYSVYPSAEKSTSKRLAKALIQGIHP